MTMCFCYHLRYEVKHIKFLNVPPNIDFVQHCYLCQFIECILSHATQNLLYQKEY